MILTDNRGKIRFTPRRVLIRASRAATSFGLTLRYAVRNRISRADVTGDAMVAVSLTSYGSRLRSAYLAIESIGRGAERPVRIVLWLDDGEPTPIPRSLRRLERRGLEIRSSGGRYGPHTKYFPYVAQLLAESPTVPLVTADDDVFYPRAWLSTLLYTIDDQTANPPIRCLRAHRVQIESGSIARYATWSKVTDTSSSLLNFATGVAGVLYPVHFLEQLRAAGTEFTETSPTADDVWLHRSAVAAGVPVQQIRATAADYIGTLLARRTGLLRANVTQNENDRQIALTYTTQDVATLARQHLEPTHVTD